MTQPTVVMESMADQCYHPMAAPINHSICNHVKTDSFRTDLSVVTLPRGPIYGVHVQLALLLFAVSLGVLRPIYARLICHSPFSTVSQHTLAWCHKLLSLFKFLSLWKVSSSRDGLYFELTPRTRLYYAIRTLISRPASHTIAA